MDIAIHHKHILLDVGDTLVKITEPFEVYTEKAISAIYELLTPESKSLFTLDYFVLRALAIRNQIRKNAHDSLVEFSFTFFIRKIEEELLVKFQVEDSEIETCYVAQELSVTVLIDGVVPFLERAKQAKKQLIVATNNFSSIHVTLLLDKFDLAKYVDQVFISGLMGVRKPSSDFIDTICSTAKIDKNSSVIIGDKPSMDLKAAFNSGIASIWYNPKQKENKEINFTFEVQNHNQIKFC
jgi:FMN phosphatase YigB (HAD superfamily)